MLRLPRLSKAVRRVLMGSAFAGAFFFAAPAAGAQEVPNFNPDQFISQVAADVKDGLAVAGISAPQVSADVDRTAAAVDVAAAAGSQAVQDVRGLAAGAVPSVSQDYAQSPFVGADTVSGLPATNPDPLGLDQVAALTQIGDAPLVVDTNYVWKNDLFNKVAAMKPLADYVLHRVPGSFFDAPQTPPESNDALSRGYSLYGPGTPLYINQNEMCTLAISGYDRLGKKVGLTAGHCGEVGQQVSSADSWQVGPTGTIVAKDKRLDYSVIEFNDRAEVTSQYNGVHAWGAGGLVNPGDILCKRGVATATTCGMILFNGGSVQVNQVCAMGGDSGAPLFKNGKVVAIITGGLGSTPCRTPWQGALHSPTQASNMDAILQDLDRRGGIGSGFRLA